MFRLPLLCGESPFVLDLNPPRHARLGHLPRLVHQTHLKEQLRRPSHGKLQGRPDPRMRVRRVFADEDGLELGPEVRREVPGLLARPIARPELIPGPDLPRAGARVLGRGDVAVHLDRGALHEGDVLRVCGTWCGSRRGE